MDGTNCELHIIFSIFIVGTIDDMKIKGVNMEMTSDRREWKEKTCCADPT
jgi:hypothetical protein